MSSYDGYMDEDAVNECFADFTKRLDASIARMKRSNEKEGAPLAPATPVVTFIGYANGKFETAKERKVK